LISENHDGLAQNRVDFHKIMLPENEQAPQTQSNSNKLTFEYIKPDLKQNHIKTSKKS